MASATSDSTTESANETRYRIEHIGEFVQKTPVTMAALGGADIRVLPGRYPVMASVSLATGRVFEGGIIFQGRDAANVERTAISYPSAAGVKELALAGAIELVPTVKRDMLGESQRTLCVASPPLEEKTLRRGLA